jgi:hypothetical protein
VKHLNSFTDADEWTYNSRAGTYDPLALLKIDSSLSMPAGGWFSSARFDPSEGQIVRLICSEDWYDSNY